MQKLLLLGDEAIAQGAIDGGISGFYAYPGTPSTEIMEYAQKSKEVAQKGIHCKWSANEKTAMEAAIGMSYTGKRAMVQMKHVGRSEEHTSELQSRPHLVCRLLLEKKKTNTKSN